MRQPLLMSLGLALTLPLAGCAPQHRATAQKLPSSILADENSPVAAPQTKFTQTTAESAETVRQVELSESDLEGAPTLPSEDTAEMSLPMPPASPSGALPVPSSDTLLLPQRSQAHEEPYPQIQSPAPPMSASPMRQVESEIQTMAQKLEAFDPALAKEFLAATRQGVMNDNLDRVLTVWQATIDHHEATRRSVQNATETISEDSPPVGLPQRNTAAIRSVEESPPTELVAIPGGSAPPAESYKPIRISYGTPEGSSETSSDGSKASAEEELELVPTSPQEEMQTKLRELAILLEKGTALSEEERVRAQVYSRLLFAMADDSRRALNPIEGTDNVDRKYWRSVIWSLIQYFDTKQLPRPESRAAEAVVSLQEAIAALRQRADLEISTPILCSRVDSFGVYEEFSEYKFAPGQTMVVYWEIRNFSSVETKEGYRTRTSWAFEIIDSRGDRRHRLGRDFGDDLCRNQRQDYFNVVKFTLPSDLAPGEYVLKVISTDKTTDKVAERQVRFLIK